MMQIFERLDIFGKPVLLNFGKNEKSKSRVGALFTLAFLGFVIWVVYYFGKEIIQKKNPNVTTSQSFQENPHEMQVFTNDTFVLNFGIQNKQTLKPFMNESIFTFQAYLYYTKRVPQDDGSSVLESENIPLDLEPCSKSYFGELGDSFSYYDLSSMYCLSKEQPNLKEGMSIFGKPESPVFQSIQFMGFLCDSSTSTVPCGTKQEMDDALGFLTLQYSKTAVDPMNYEKSITRFRDAYFTSTDSDVTKELDLFVSPLEMKTDDGWLTESYTTEKYVQYSKISEFTNQRATSDPFFYIFVLSDGVTTQYTRSYIKVQDIAARVNGIISFSLILLIIMVTPYVRLKFYEQLIHDIFDVKILKDPKGKIKRSKTKNPSLVDGKLETATPPQILSKQRTQATKNELLRIEEDISPRKPQEVQLQIMEEKKEAETIYYFPENLFVSSPKGESEIKVQQQEENLFKIQPKEEIIEKKQEHLLSVEDNNLPTPRGKTAFKKGVYGSPSLLEMKPDLTKPTFKTLLGDNNETHDVFEDILFEMAINQQENEENENNNKQIIIPVSTERAGLYKTEEGDQTKRDQEDRPDNPPEDMRTQIRKSPSLYLRSSDQINLTFWEYLRSFVSPNELIKEKMDILNEGIRRINERLDIFNLLKKLRELDKLKILLLEDDQYILFEGLPKPEIMKETGSRTLKHNIKNAKFIQENVKNDLIYASYQNLKLRDKENLIDQKLLRIFDDIFIE